MEAIMNLRSLIPFQNRDTPAPPEAFLFGPLHREIDRLFDDFARGLTGFGPQGQSSQGLPTLMPKMDVTETDKEIEITVEMPGLERKDVEITLEDNVLTIRGEKVEREEGNGSQQQGDGQKQARKDDKAKGQQQGQTAEQAGEKNKSYHVSERSYGVFLRVLQLPPGIDPASVQATMSKGVLRIKLPKPANSEAKKIDVKEAA
jgi:HSP20 family protein